MTQEAPTPHGISYTQGLLEEMGIVNCECLRDEILVLGLKEGFANLATPSVEQGPMDHPTFGIAFLCGPKCADPELGIAPGMVCYFPKFSAQEIHIKNRRYFVVKGGDVKMKKVVTLEELQTIACSSY